MNLYLKKWFNIQDDVSKCRLSIDPIHLFKTLMIWCKEVSLTKDNYIKMLYDLYLSNYEKLDIEEYSMDHLLHTFKDILEYDFLSEKPANIERAIVITRNILWNVVAFKIDKECPSCSRDEFRILTDEYEKQLFISCDQCTYTENIKGEKINVEVKLVPAKRYLVNAYKDRFK